MFFFSWSGRLDRHGLSNFACLFTLYQLKCSQSLHWISINCMDNFLALWNSTDNFIDMKVCLYEINRALLIVFWYDWRENSNCIVYLIVLYNFLLKKIIVCPGRVTYKAQSFNSLMADLRQDIIRFSSFSRCLNGTFPWRNCSVKTMIH